MGKLNFYMKTLIKKKKKQKRTPFLCNFDNEG